MPGNKEIMRHPPTSPAFDKSLNNGGGQKQSGPRTWSGPGSLEGQIPIPPSNGTAESDPAVKPPHR
jgi:hypothetical protein